MNKLKVRFMLAVCQFIKDWYWYSVKDPISNPSLQILIDDLNTELEKE